MSADPQTGRSRLALDAEAIFRAGVAAVQPQRLIERAFKFEQAWLLVGDEPLRLGDYRRIVIVGAGKASGAMATALVEQLQPRLGQAQELVGWVNVPDDCRATAGPVRIHRSRPAGSNLPTERVVAGTREIVALVDSLTPRDLCFCLISGGGSALLAWPVDGISLADKCESSRLLAARGATIQQLNRFRRQLSQVKGGRLVARQQAGKFISLILSDVLGDPLELIASGPTVSDPANTPDSARVVLEELGLDWSEFPASIGQWLRRATPGGKAAHGNFDGASHAPSRAVRNLLVGSLALAVEAAAAEARTRGYQVTTEIQQRPEVTALEEGGRLANWILDSGLELGAGPAKENGRASCLISGGEPIVRLCSQPGLGGRNQELVLAGLAELLAAAPGSAGWLNDFCLLSAGTDGEDGTTTVAGARIDGDFIRHCRELRLDPTPYLATNNSHQFFSEAGGLLLTGPTGTNVGDLRIVIRSGGQLTGENQLN
ncbi:MAG: glycerate kinase [Planctomycetota bacterium]